MSFTRAKELKELTLLSTLEVLIVTFTLPLTTVTTYHQLGRMPDCLLFK